LRADDIGAVNKQKAESPMAIELDTMTIAKVQACLTSGAFTAEDLTTACLARIAEFNPVYNAIIFENEDALDDAREIDRKRAAGEVLPPLAGVPLVVKDTMDMAGYPTTGGWRLLSSKTGGIDLFPERDSPVVARMRQAGCIILGKTNVPVLSATGTHADDSWAGPTINSAYPDGVPGGSSAGTASAVAAGFAVLGLAEETGGSIQNPASAHALVGVKPTFGLVPNTGVMPLGANTLDVMGPIARTVRDAAMMLDVLAGPCDDDPKTAYVGQHLPKGGYAASLNEHALTGARLGLYGEGWRKNTGGWRSQPLHADILSAYQRVQGEIAKLGAILIDDPMAGSGFADIAETVGGVDDFDIRGMEPLAYDLQVYLRNLGPKAAIKSFAAFAEATKSENPFSPSGVLSYLGQSTEFLKNCEHPDQAPDLSGFKSVRKTYVDILTRVFAEQNLDALVFPQMADLLPKAGSGESIRETTVCEINIAGLPVVTVPAGYLDDGSPFNLVFVGKPFSELTLMSLALHYEQAMQHRKIPQLRSAF